MEELLALMVGLVLLVMDKAYDEWRSRRK